MNSDDEFDKERAMQTATLVLVTIAAIANIVTVFCLLWH